MDTTKLTKLLTISLFTLFLASACAPAQNPECDTNPDAEGCSSEGTPGEGSFPAFSSSWGVQRDMYEKAARYYEDNKRNFANTRYVTIIDFSLNAGKKRWFLFDLKTGKVEKYVTSVGRGSDPDGDGNATAFSNVPGSKQSSLGFYKTAETYTGSNGYSMRLDGLSSTNSKARSRAIVVHPASYVSESSSWAGRSEGCPALDPGVSRSVIDRIKGGSMMLIDI
jgi:hypothetical protein